MISSKVLLDSQREFGNDLSTVALGTIYSHELAISMPRDSIFTGPDLDFYLYMEKGNFSKFGKICYFNSISEMQYNKLFMSLNFPCLIEKS